MVSFLKLPVWSGDGTCPQWQRPCLVGSKLALFADRSCPMSMNPQATGLKPCLCHNTVVTEITTNNLP
eukprot:6000636-Amphidinium_carterae.1